MNNQIKINEKAWDYRVYEFLDKKDDVSTDHTKVILKDPGARVKNHKEYFNHLEGTKIAIISKTNRRKVSPLSLMGADITTFDISEENNRYKLELKYANTSTEYVFKSIYDIKINKYKEYFDILYLESTMLNYFNDLNKFMDLIYSLLKNGGRIVLEDFHPVEECISEDFSTKVEYFHKEDLEYDENKQKRFPNVYSRLYTLSEIINSMILVGFKLKRFDEHPRWTNNNVPGEFTILAIKK